MRVSDILELEKPFSELRPPLSKKQRDKKNKQKLVLMTKYGKESKESF